MHSLRVQGSHTPPNFHVIIKMEIKLLLNFPQGYQQPLARSRLIGMSSSIIWLSSA